MGLDSGGGKPCKHERADLLSLCSVHPKGLEIIAISQKIIVIVLQENFSAMTRLDQNRAAGQIAEKVIWLLITNSDENNLLQ